MSSTLNTLGRRLPSVYYYWWGREGWNTGESPTRIKDERVSPCEPLARDVRSRRRGFMFPREVWWRLDVSGVSPSDRYVRVVYESFTDIGEDEPNGIFGGCPSRCSSHTSRQTWVCPLFPNVTGVSCNFVIMTGF